MRWRRWWIGFALLLLGMFAWTRVLVARAEDDFPPLGEFVEAAGLRLHYTESGPASGRPVVFLHGAFGGLHDFHATVLPEAEKRWRCFVFDRAGHGYSEPPDESPTPRVHARILRAALERLGVARPILVGFSWGGAVAMAYAVEYPDAIAGAVLLNGAAYPWPGGVSAAYHVDDWFLLGPLTRHTLVGPLATLLVPAQVEAAFAPAAVPDSFRGSPLPLALRPSSYHRNAAEMRLLSAALAAQCRHYPDVRTPVVILAGTGDRVASHRLHSKQLHTTLPRSELTLLPEAGHQILYTHAAAVLAAIARAADRGPDQGAR